MTGGKAVRAHGFLTLTSKNPCCCVADRSAWQIRSDLLLGYLKTILIFPVEVFVANILESIHGTMSDVTGQDPSLHP